MSKADRIRIESRGDRVDDGDYDGIIVRVERGPSPWAPRKLATWEQELGRERRQDWAAYYYVELYRGAARKHPCGSWTMGGGASAAASGLLPLPLLHAEGQQRPIGHPLLSLESAPLAHPDAARHQHGWCGHPVRGPDWVGRSVRVGHKTRDRYQQPLPDDPRLQPSVIRAVLSAFPSESLQSAVSSAKWSADREEQLSTPVETASRGFTNRTPMASLASSRHGIDECVIGRTTAVAGDHLDQMASTTADDGGLSSPYVPPAPLSRQERERRIHRMFGGHPEISGRGPCRDCGDMTLGRPGENGRCPRCDWDGRWVVPLVLRQDSR